MDVEIVSVAGQEIPVMYYRGRRVITLAQIDQLHERPPGTAKRTFYLRRNKFVKDREYFRVPADEQMDVWRPFD